MAQLETTMPNGYRLADDLADDLTDEARSAFARAADRVSETYSAAREIAQEVEPFVRARPYLSLALAALAGLILGGLFLPPRPRVIYVKPGH